MFSNRSDERTVVIDEITYEVVFSSHMLKRSGLRQVEKPIILDIIEEFLDDLLYDIRYNDKFTLYDKRYGVSFTAELKPSNEVVIVTVVVGKMGGELIKEEILYIVDSKGTINPTTYQEFIDI